MKIFYAVQCSNNDGRRWLLRNDACMNIAIGIVSCLLKKYPDVEVVLKVPHKEDVADVETYSDLFDASLVDRIIFYEEAIPISPVLSRFSFNMSYHLMQRGLFESIDVMINDENTLTKNWRVVFKQLGLNIPIISTNYFLDSPLAAKVPRDIRYYERQMETFICSDLNTFQCKAGMKEAEDAYSFLFRGAILNKSVWGIGCHAEEIMRYHALREPNQTPVVYFGNRITDTANRYTNWHKFAEAIGLVAKMYAAPFDAMMLNPTKKVTDTQLKIIDELSSHKVVVLGNNYKFMREDYLKFINKADISCNLFTTEVHGGVTSAEAGLARNIVVMPRINNYIDRFEGFDYPLLFDMAECSTEIDVQKLADAIVKALHYLGTPEEEKLRRMCYDACYKNESYEMAVDRIYKDLKSLTGGKK